MSQRQKSIYGSCLKPFWAITHPKKYVDLSLHNQTLKWLRAYYQYFSRWIWIIVCVSVGDQQYLNGAPSDHLLRLHLSGEATILDPHARRCLLSAAVWYYNHFFSHSHTHTHMTHTHTHTIYKACALTPYTFLPVLSPCCVCCRFHRKGCRWD